MQKPNVKLLFMLFRFLNKMKTWILNKENNINRNSKLIGDYNIWKRQKGPGFWINKDGASSHMRGRELDTQKTENGK